MERIRMLVEIFESLPGFLTYDMPRNNQGEGVEKKYSKTGKKVLEERMNMLHLKSSHDCEITSSNLEVLQEKGNST